MTPISMHSKRLLRAGLLSLAAALAFLGVLGCATNATLGPDAPTSEVTGSGTPDGVLSFSPNGIPFLPDSLTRGVGSYNPGVQYYRYRDMLNNHYMGAPTTGDYDGWYGGSPTAHLPAGTVTYTKSNGAKLSLTLTASGLKPHFAHQIKLEGQPVHPYGSWDPSNSYDWANQQIGRAGRWWCDDDKWNVTDAQLSAHVGHTIRGYVLFDFFLTDAAGNATQTAVLNSSFHVLWRSDQRGRIAGIDGPLRSHTIASTDQSYSDTQPFRSGTFSVYAEGEPNRPKPGKLTMRRGNYLCRLLLTEESFHNSPPDVGWPYGLTWGADGGFWAHAMSDEAFSFKIN